MARRRYPQERSTWSVVGSALHSVPAGSTVEVYDDDDPTGPPVAGSRADVLLADGSAPGTAGALETVAYSTLPDWLGPDGDPWGPDTLIVKVNDGPPWRVEARVDDRLDAIEARVVPLAAFASPRGAPLTVAAGSSGFPVPYDCTLVGTRLTAGTAPAGSAVVVDLNRNGTTVYTVQANRPRIEPGATSGGPGPAPDVTALLAGDVLTPDVDQVGSAAPGADLVVVPLVVPL